MEKTLKLSLAALAMIVFCGLGVAPAEAQYSENYKLMKAIKDGDYYSARAAILSGAQVNARDDHDVPYVCIVADKGDTDMLNIMLDQGANPDLARRDGENPLMIAAAKGNSAMVGVLLAHKADPNEQDKNGETALIKAARLGNRDIVEKLIAAKADIDHQDYTGKSALGYAMDNRRQRVVQVLKKAGATD